MRRASVESGFIALNGEAGYEPEVLRGGLHMFFPFMYRIHKSDLVTVGQGRIAYVFARDGAPLGASQVLGANDTEDKSDFQDARRFLLGGGQKGLDGVLAERLVGHAHCTAKEVKYTSSARVSVLV